MKKLLSILTFALSAITVAAGPVDRQKAAGIAKNFFNAKGIALSEEVPSFRQSRMAKVGSTTEEKPSFYVFNADAGKGFVIVSGDDRTAEILAYSDEGSFDMEQIPENMRSWLQFYEDRIKYIDENNIQIEKETTAQRQMRKASKAHHSIAPLLTCYWNQGDPYNQQCPIYYKGDGSSGRSATGCVATAIAQVLYHHKYPAETAMRIPAHSCSYKLNDGTTKTSTLSAIPSGTKIDWENMRDRYDGNQTQEEKDAVAFLMRLVGQSVKMGYGESSGSSYADSRNLFVKYLGFDDGVQILRSDNYGIQEWFEMMYDELDAGYPIGYGGSSTGGGHAFVVDGFDGDEFFHLNWGWGGGSNGYFRIDVLNPGDNSGIGASSSADGYSMAQDAIMYLRPGDDGIPYTPDASEPHMSINDTEITGTSIRSNYINWTGSTNSFDGTIVMYDENNNLVPATTDIKSVDNLAANYFQTWSFYMTGKFAAPGTYRLSPASKLKKNTKWIPLYNLKDEYILATVDEDMKVKLTKVTPGSGLEVSDWYFPGTLKAGDQQDVNITIKNNDGDFKHELALYASKTTSKGNSQSRALIGVKGGESDEFTFYFKPTEVGTYNVWLTLNSDNNKVIGQTTVDIKSTAQNSANLRFSSMSTTNQGIGGRAIGTVSIQNKASKDYKGRVKLQLWVKATDGDYFWSSSSTMVDVEAAAGKSASVPFEFNGLEMNRTYIMCAYYSYGGELENAGLTYDHSFSTKSGLLYWNNYGAMYGAQQSSSYTVPTNACGILIEGATFNKIVPNSNPNTIYAISRGTTAPTGLDGHNVVNGEKSTDITLNTEKAYVIPASFTAEKASLSHTFKQVCDGEKGYDVVTLPFAPTSITVDGVEVSLNEGGIYMKEFSMEDDNKEVIFADATQLRGGTPYVIGANETFTGKTIVFSAENAEFLADDRDNKVIASEHFRFQGTTCSPRLTDIYMLNEEGSAFELYTGTTKKSISGGYFTTKLTEKPERIVIANEGTGISEISTNFTEGAVFDLQGRKVNNAQKGIYIIGNKKYIRK